MMLHPKSVFITGANRGIGLEFVRQFLKLDIPPRYLFATCRHPTAATELQEIAKDNSNVKVMRLDVTETASYSKVREQVEATLEGEGLNLLINNAGILIRNSLADVTEETLMDTFKTNTVAPLLLAKEFLPLVRLGASKSTEKAMSCSRAAIINISSKVGSMDDNAKGGSYSYRISKAGVNMVTKNLSVDMGLKEDDIMCVALHPGWVLTEMGGVNALISTEQSVQGLMNVMGKLNKSNNGLFYDYAFKPILW